MAWYLKWPADSGNVTTNNKLVQITGIVGTLATVRYTLHEAMPTYSRPRYIFDMRRLPNSTSFGNDVGYLLQEGTGTTSTGTSGWKINGGSVAAPALFGTISAGAVCEFNVGAVPSSGCIAFGARFNEREHNYGLAVRNIVIIDDAGTHTIDMSSSGGSSNEFTSTDGAVTLKLFNFTGGQWVFYNSITSTGIPNNTLGAALNQACAINLNNYFTGATSYSVLSGSLPTGLSISGNQIVGTPTTAQSTTLVIRASNSIDTLDSAEITFNTGLWYLKQSGSTGYLQVSTALSFTASDNWVFRFAVQQTSDAFFRVFGNPSAFGTRIFINSTGLLLRIETNTTDYIEFALPSGYSHATRRDFVITKSGSSYTLTIDGGAPINATFLGTNRAWAAGVATAFFRSGGTTMSDGSLYYFEFEKNGVIQNSYDPNTSGGVGNLLIDRVSNNNGTQAGTWPADNAEWVSYAPAGGGAAALDGNATAVATATSALTTAIRLAASAAAIAVATASLTTQIPLQAAPTATATATGQLTTQPSGFTASAQATAATTGQLSTQIRLTANGQAQAIGAGQLTTQIRLTGFGQGLATATGELQGGQGFQANAQAIATATGMLTVQKPLAATATATASASGQLTNQIRLQASVTSQASASGILTVGARLQGTAQAVAIASATLTGTAAQLVADAAASATTTADLFTRTQFDAGAYATATAWGDLTTVASGYAPDPDRLTYVLKETRISAVYADNRMTIVDHADRFHAVRGNA